MATHFGSSSTLPRNLFRVGGVATATKFLTTLAGDKTATHIGSTTTTAAATENAAVAMQRLRMLSQHVTPTTSRTATTVSTTAVKPPSSSSSSSIYQSILNSTARQHQQRPQQYTARSFSTSATDATKTATSSSSRKGFVEWYEGHLESNPLPTKMITGGILWSIGDAVAQIVPEVAASYNNNDDASTTSSTTTKEFQYDWARTGRAALFGFAVHAPTSHVHFNFLEWMTVKGGFTGLSIPVFKTIMEQFVYWSWISNSMYHAFMGYMQGMNTTEVIQRIDDVLWDTQKAQWAFWIPVQLLNFQFIPVRHQLNVVLLTSIVWTALLSAWYPPVEDDDSSKSDDDATENKKEQ